MGDRLEGICWRAAQATPGPWCMTDGWGPAADGHMRFVSIADSGFRSVVDVPGADTDLAARREDAEFIAHAREDVPWLLGQLTVAQTFADAWQEHAEAHRATLEQVAELVQQWRAKGAQGDFLGVVNVWDEAADQLSAVLAKEGSDDHAAAETISYTADVVLLTDDGQVLLIQCGHDPHAGKWAFPGGHVDQGETSSEAAYRELEEEVGIRFEHGLSSFGTYDKPGRDPRGRYVTVAFTATIPNAIQPTAGDDAKAARWWPLADLPAMAFDHAEILVDLPYGPAGRG
jgi:8-oxo-dGTP diphosphatase